MFAPRDIFSIKYFIHLMEWMEKGRGSDAQVEMRMYIGTHTHTMHIASIMLYRKTQQETYPHPPNMVKLPFSQHGVMYAVWHWHSIKELTLCMKDRNFLVHLMSSQGAQNYSTLHICLITNDMTKSEQEIYSH